MSDRDFSRVPAATAAEVCQRFRLGRVAAALLRDDLTPGQFLGLLVEGRHFKDATSFLAHALPVREAVWWAVLCVREAVGPAPPEPVASALRAAEAWVQDPTEENRRAAREASKAAGTSSPAGLAAGAAFRSGGSIGPPDGPEVLPREFATARAVVFAVMLAASQDSPAKAPVRFPTFFARGVEVATGAYLWSEPFVQPPQTAEAPTESDPQTAAVAAPDDQTARSGSRRPRRLAWD
jgi:hypothetical protein